MQTHNTPITVAHLVASPFLGGPERQILGLADALCQDYRSVFLCFAENGKAKPFVNAAQAAGHLAITLEHNHPRLLACATEATRHLGLLGAQLLVTHNYKPNMVGLLAAARRHIPIIAVSRGWTWATAKVRVYERLDRVMLRQMHRVVCVSEGQAQKVRASGVDEQRIRVIRNAIDVSRFAPPREPSHKRLRSLFARPPVHIVIAVGRLSPEKGYEQLVTAAQRVCASRDDTGFVLIGDGPERQQLREQIQAAGLGNRVILAGFRDDVDQLLPDATVLVQSSYTEGMPNVVLEAMAASVPVVATDVGGTGELVVHGGTGMLVPPRDPHAISSAVLAMLADPMMRAAMGIAGHQRVRGGFTFAAQAQKYEALFNEMLAAHGQRPAPVKLAEVHS